MQAREDVVVPEKQDTVDEEKYCRFRRVKLENSKYEYKHHWKNAVGKIVKRYITCEIV